jgi:chitinase
MAIQPSSSSNEKYKAFTMVSFLFLLMLIATSARATRSQNVVYWGQNTNENSLSTYCTPAAGVDMVILSFLSTFGNGQTIPSGNLGPSCYISPQGEPQGCEELALEIQACQNQSIPVMISLGGKTGTYFLRSQSEAEEIGQNLWEAYGHTNGTGAVPRPFGTTFVNGWDFNIENASGNQYYSHLISLLRSYFLEDPNYTYYISGAPQCVIPEPDMQTIIQNSNFDFLWVQYYDNALCSFKNASNYESWVKLIQDTPSANATIFFGLPASPDESGSAGFYWEPAALASMLRHYQNDSTWGGVMLWDAGYSTMNVNDNCNYAQEVRHILDTGMPCPVLFPTNTTEITPVAKAGTRRYAGKPIRSSK